jgi:hypothetical protein
MRKQATRGPERGEIGDSVHQKAWWKGVRGRYQEQAPGHDDVVARLFDALDETPQSDSAGEGLAVGSGVDHPPRSTQVGCPFDGGCGASVQNGRRHPGAGRSCGRCRDRRPR